jgi:alkylation response protein AidB-like acyl-CoA dehydrogenase
MTPDELQTEFSAWLRQNVSKLASFRETPESFESAFERDQALQRLLWEADWTRWGWPEEAGGLGGTVRHRAAIYEQLCEAGLPVPEPTQIVEVVGPALLRFTPELARTRLPGFLSASETWCLGFSEPGSGSDLGSVRTQLTEAPDGSYRLSGQKIWVGFGHLADYSLVLSRSPVSRPGKRDLAMSFVRLDSSGVTRRPIRALTGRNEFAEIFFDDVVVEEGDLVGELHDGWKVIAYLFQYERGSYAWPRQARLHERFDALLARGVTGPESAARVGDTYMNLAALRLATRQSLRRLADPDEGRVGPEASVDKLLLVRAETSLLQLARDLLHPELETGDGSEAALWRFDYLYARALSIFGGTNEIQRNIVAETLLGMPREPSVGH